MTSSVISPSEGEREGGRPRLGDLRSHLTCVLCAGYFIDATTIVECLHTFCRSCILRHLEASSYCPICDVMIHRTKGSSSLRADCILQTMVYKLVPGLFRHEMKMRRDFYDLKPYADPELPGWAKGDVSSYAPHVFTPDEQLQLRLVPFDADRSQDSVEQRGTSDRGTAPPVRYLRCQAGTPLSVLQKFVRSKYQLPPTIQVQLIYGQHVLPDDISLMDLGYLYRPALDDPVQLEFRLVRKRPLPTVTASSTTVIPQLVATSEPTEEPATSTSASPSETEASAPTQLLSETDSETAQVTAAKSELAEETPEPPAKRQRTGDDTQQPVVKRLFDVDGEEPSSPKEVEDIIATLDAEEQTPQSGTSQQQSVASVSADTDEAESMEGVARCSSTLPADSEENDVERVMEESTDQTDCDRVSSVGSTMHCEPSAENSCEGCGEACVDNADSYPEHKVSEGEGVSSEAVSVALRIDAQPPDGEYLEDADNFSSTIRLCTGNAGAEEHKPSAASINALRTSAGSRSPKPTAGKHSEDRLEGKLGDVDSQSVCDDDVASECGLVVDEGASSDACVPEAGVPDNVSTDAPAAAHENTTDVPTRPGEPVAAIGASTEVPPAVTTTRAIPEEDVDRGRNSPTLTRGPGCTTGTQTSMCSVATCSELPAGSELLAPSDSSDASKDSAKHIGCSTSPLTQSKIKGDARSMSSVSCGTQDTEELIEGHPRMPPKKVDCSVQTAPAENEKRSHVSGNSVCASPETDSEARKRMSIESSRLGSRLPERKESLNDREMITPNKVWPSLNSGPSKLSHPELASRLVQSAVVCDSRQRSSTDINIEKVIKLPSASSNVSKSQELGIKKSDGLAKKATSDKTTKHSPDSSSVPSVKPSSDIKHFFKEVPRGSSGVAKYLEKNHNRILTGSPLDLSKRANKTAADSTSMVPKRPGHKTHNRKQKPAKAQGTQTIHSIVKNLARSEHISLTPIPSGKSKATKAAAPPKQKHQPLQQTPPTAFPYPPGMNPHDFYSSPLHVNTSMASRLGYDMAMRNLLTLSHMAMAQGGMGRSPNMFPMHPMFPPPPPPKGHDFHSALDPSLLRQQAEARMGASSKKASPTAGTMAPQLRTPKVMTSASIQHMEDLTRTVGKIVDKERHSVTVTPIPPK